MRHIVHVCGAGEKQGKECLSYQVFQKFWKKDDKHIFLSYPGSIGPVNLTPDPMDFQESATQSRHLGVKALDDLGASIPDGSAVIIIGYSLGAWVVSDWLEMQFRRGAVFHSTIKAITVGSPRRKTEFYGGGIAGDHGQYPTSITHVEVSNYNDVVSNTPRTSALRMLPFVEEVLTTGQPSDVRNNWLKLVNLWFKGNYQLPSVRDADLLRRYANRTGHERDYFADWARNAAAHVLR